MHTSLHFLPIFIHLTLSPTQLMTFSTLLRKVQKRHPRHAILIDFYHIGDNIFRNGLNQIMNKLGGSNCVKVLSTFPCIVYSDVQMKSKKCISALGLIRSNTTKTKINDRAGRHSHILLALLIKYPSLSNCRNWS
jgi:hypothetical protein